MKTLFMSLFVGLGVSAAAAVAQAEEYVHFGPNTAYNPTRHEFVATMIKVGVDSGDEQPVLRRYKADGSFVAELAVHAAGADLIQEAGLAYDPVRDRFFVAWHRGDHLEGALVDAATYAVTRIAEVWDPLEDVTVPVGVRVAFNPVLDRFHIGFFNDSGSPKVVTVQPNGLGEAESVAISGVLSAVGDVLHMAVNPTDGKMAVGGYDGSSQVHFGIYEEGTSATGSLSFNLFPDVKYISSTNQFMIAFPNAADFSGRLMDSDGLSSGVIFTIDAAADSSQAMALLHHAGLNRMLFAFTDADGATLRLKQLTTAGAAAGFLATDSIPSGLQLNEMELVEDTQCGTTLWMTELQDVDPITKFRVVGTPCATSLTAEPNPLPFSDLGTVSIRANRGALTVTKLEVVTGADSYAVAKDDCTGRTLRRDERCELQVRLLKGGVPGVLRVSSDGAAPLDLALDGKGGGPVALVAPGDGATGLDPASVGLVWTSSGATGYRALMCKDAAMTDCQSTTSVVRANK